MTATAQQDRARLFRSLHTASAPLALANAWDAASARLAQQAGAPAVATTSAGVAWALGSADGDRIGRQDAVALVARVASVVDVPVTADIESGFGATPAELAETVTGVIGAGAVGINLEDSRHGDGGPRLRNAAEQSERIAAARAAAEATGVPLFINARVDTYIRAAGEPETRMQDVLTRAAAYLAAGADGIFVLGVSDPATIAGLAELITGPLNILARPGLPSVAELGRLGVARVSLGDTVAKAAYTLGYRAAAELAAHGTYTVLADALAHPDPVDLNALLR
ncbi:isocitrate lyase/phosphoenolpyruvate mutase family protein [Streptacidiphilus sp. PB12-B1b]|uniref:isocitrate lyase/PEP mutase family protein n=1 Tax=Streptacidiphilus sp. PB12-B1b TaxID=2705012 RepID=UPI0015F85801|nr:isocitrate lyase/phosphoenolpyruvate mutase family protein [Streptacidiphilus sp. PB12-B1b]QMU75164.1 isocitrate lyase/phosphoenolpyruvate mutase family protein [Streptacidiphilus sp. PB12-B1b]